MRIKYLAHACFYLEDERGVKIIIDPYEKGAYDAMNYDPVDEEADIVLITHDHADHNAEGEVRGNPEVVKEHKGEKEIKGIKIKGIETFHDEKGGSERGKNVMYLIEIDGIRVLHTGDLGHELSEKELKEIREVDVALVPIGGYFTIDKNVAFKLLESLSPKVFVPMHYKTEKIGFPIEPLDKFLEIAKEYPKKEFHEEEIKIEKQSLPPSTEIWILKYTR
jgi:L-ascorbate metabolism protein UlaG (beta-lactamase superfamily)